MQNSFIFGDFLEMKGDKFSGKGDKFSERDRDLLQTAKGEKLGGRLPTFR